MSKPSVWIILVAVMLIIVGVGIWSVSGKLETMEDAVIAVSGGEGHMYLTYDQVANVTEGMAVRVGDYEGEIVNVEYSPMDSTDDIDVYTKQLGKMTDSEWYYEVTVAIGVEDGVYSSQIVTDSVSPIYFLFN